jgi:hypothetical protein
MKSGWEVLIYASSMAMRLDIIFWAGIMHSLRDWVDQGGGRGRGRRERANREQLEWREAVDRRGERVGR